MRTMFCVLLISSVVIAGCGDSSSDNSAAATGTTGQTTTATDAGEITKTDASRWVENWCDLEEGMSPDQVIELMGEPTGQYDGSNGEAPQVEYDGYGYGFTVFFDANDKAYEFFAAEPAGTNAAPECDLGKE